MFVVLRPGVELTTGCETDLGRPAEGAVATTRPDDVVAVPAIPRTLTGKKLEVPVKRVLAGAKVTDVASSDTLVEPDSLEPFAEYATIRTASASG